MPDRFSDSVLTPFLYQTTLDLRKKMGSIKSKFACSWKCAMGIQIILAYLFTIVFSNVCRSSYSQLYHAWRAKERLDVSLWMIRYMYTIGPRNLLSPANYREIMSLNYLEISYHWNVDQNNCFETNLKLTEYILKALYIEALLYQYSQKYVVMFLNPTK